MYIQHIKVHSVGQAFLQHKGLMDGKPSQETFCHYRLQQQPLGAGTLSYSASVSTALLDWERHKYLMSPPATTALTNSPAARGPVYLELTVIC